MDADDGGPKITGPRKREEEVKKREDEDEEDEEEKKGDEDYTMNYEESDYIEQ